MYIVKRGFRNLGEVLTVGTEITDPTVIKHFKSRLGAGDIIVVTEQNYYTCKAFFKAKYGVVINDLNTVPTEVHTEEPTKSKEASVASDIIHAATTKEVKKPANAKAVTKVAATAVNNK